MLGMLYIAITALLMLGAIFDQEGWAGLAIVLLVALSFGWLVLARRDATDHRRRR